MTTMLHHHHGANDAAPSQVSGHGAPTISVRRYPTREQQPPQHLGDYVSH